MPCAQVVQSRDVARRDFGISKLSTVCARVGWLVEWLIRNPALFEGTPPH